MSCTMGYSKTNVLSYIRVTEEATAEVEKSPVAEKQGGEDETADASKELSAEEQEKKEAEDKVQSHLPVLETIYYENVC